MVSKDEEQLMEEALRLALPIIRGAQLRHATASEVYERLERELRACFQMMAASGDSEAAIGYFIVELGHEGPDRVYLYLGGMRLLVAWRS